MGKEVVRRRSTDLSEYDITALRTIGTNRIPRFQRKGNVKLTQSQALTLLWLLNTEVVRRLIDEDILNEEQIQEIRNAMSSIL